jgi:hypothetical protein
MNESEPTDEEFPLRGEKPPRPFLWIGYEFLDLYLPIIGPDCLAVYAYFARRHYFDNTLKHDIRNIAQSCGLKSSTVSRALEVLNQLKLIKLIRFGGNRQSECQLSDVWTIATRLGATFDRKTHSYRFPEPVLKQLTAEVGDIRARQQGKSDRNTSESAVSPCGNPSVSVTPEKHQRVTRETQAYHQRDASGDPSNIERKRIKETPTPTPTPNETDEAHKDKSFPNKDEKEGWLLAWVRIKFTGVMKDIRDHLLNSRPHSLHLTNGFSDWRSFGFGSLAVQSWRDEDLTLVLSTNDPEAARRGLDKYRKLWQASLRKWYECEVRVEFVKAEAEVMTAHGQWANLWP